MTCSSENTVTGRNGKIHIGTSLVARVTQWAVNPTLATTSEWGDSDSEGYTNRAIGRRDATFTAEGKYEHANNQYELFDLGVGSVEATLWLNAALYWYFPCCICLDFSLTVNIDTEEVVGWTSSWGADGKFYYPGQAGALTSPATHPGNN
jgi:hypothetical protein